MQQSIELSINMTNDLLYEAATHFFDDPYQISIVGDSSGYSNGRLAHVTDKRGQWWCLRTLAQFTLFMAIVSGACGGISLKNLNGQQLTLQGRSDGYR